jgi:hypothetical protein
MDTNADGRTEKPLVDRLARAGLSATAIREIFAVFLLLIWAAQHPDEDNTHDFSRVLLSRMHPLNLRSLHVKDIAGILGAIADTLERTPSSQESPFKFCLSTLAESARRVGSVEGGMLEELAAWVGEALSHGRLQHSDLLQIFDRITRATGDPDRWPFAFPGWLDPLINEFSGSGPTAEDLGAHLSSEDFLSIAAKDAIEEIERYGRIRTDFDLGASRFGPAIVRLILSGIGISPQTGAAKPVRAPASETFDFVLMNPPFGAKVARELRHPDEPLISIRDPEALFLQRALEQLAPGGRAAIIVPVGMFFRGGTTKELRRWLVENGHIAVAVTLPTGTFSQARALASGLLVLDKDGGHQSVRMIDASILGPLVTGKADTDIEVVRSADGDGRRILDIGYRRRATPGDPASEGQLELCEAWEVSVRELAEHHWTLMGRWTHSSDQHWLNSRLGQQLTQLRQVMPLRSCARVRVGRYIGAKKLRSEPAEDGAPGYFRISDIRDGVAEKVSLWLLPAVAKEIGTSQLLQPGDVLLSRSGTIDKAGVVSDRVSAIAGGGILVISVDWERLDPRFLVAYLRCRECRIWLKENSRRTVIPNLTVPLMNDMTVPVPELSLQRDAAASFRENGTDVLEYLREALGQKESPREKEPAKK